MSGDDPRSPVADSDPAPQETFALVGNEYRAAILQVLGAEPHSVHSFSDLRSRVAEDLDSSQFNYHLQQLVGHFVERIDGGYRIRPRGRTLHRMIRAGTFTETINFAPLEAGFDCYFCGSPVKATYHDGLFTIQCGECAHLYTITDPPPSALATDDHEELLARINQYSRHKLLAFARGVCPICANALDTRLRPPDTVPIAGIEHRRVLVDRSCPHCGNQMFMSVGEALLRDSGVIAFCRAHGIDVTTTPTWELEFATTDRSVEIRSTDPWAVALTLSCDGDSLELVVDGTLNVIERTES